MGQPAAWSPRPRSVGVRDLEKGGSLRSMPDIHTTMAPSSSVGAIKVHACNSARLVGCCAGRSIIVIMTNVILSALAVNCPPWTFSEGVVALDRHLSGKTVAENAARSALTSRSALRPLSPSANVIVLAVRSSSVPAVASRRQGAPV